MAEKLSQLKSIIGMSIHSCSACVSQPSLTATTTDLGIGLNGKLVLSLGDLANPKIGLNLVPNPL